MKKRIVSMLLLLCLVVTAIPVFVLPTAAIAGLGEGENEATVTVEFRKADGWPGSGKGTVIASHTYTTVNGLLTSAIELPTEAECSAKSLNAADIIGWYETTPTGTPITPQAYVGNYYFAENTTLTFYPYTKSSTLAFISGPQNLPLYSGSGADVITATRGGWEIGYYDSQAFFKNYAYVNTTPMFVIKDGTNYLSAWTYGGVYLGYSASSSLITSGNSGYVNALQWNAIANGTVSIDISSFSVYGQDAAIAEGADTTVFVAIAKNDKIVWPTAIAGSAVTTKNFADAGYQKYNFVGKDSEIFPGVSKGGFVTAYVSDGNAETANDGIINGIEVAAGDEITIILGRGSVAKAYDPSPTITYTEFGNERNANIVTTLIDPLSSSSYVTAQFDANNTPILHPDGSEVEVEFPGAWEFIVYPSYKTIGTSEADIANIYTRSDKNDGLITSLKDYASAGSPPAFFQNKNQSSYGDKFAISVNGDKGGAAGFRYTAERTGLITPSFDCLLVSGSQGKYPERTRIAIFVDGVKVWPEGDGWYAPYTSDYVKGTDISASVNTLLPENIFVTEGSEVEFLIYRTAGTGWNGAGNKIHPVVQYTTAEIDPEFTATASLGSSLALTLGSAQKGPWFAPRTNFPYIDASSLKFIVDSGDAGFTVSTTGTIAVISDIAAKQMTDKVSYTLTGDIKKPDGTVAKDLVLATGSISVADYLKSLLAANISEAYNDLAIATLNYGAAAQTYFNYKTDNLANTSVVGSLSFTLPEAESALAFVGSGAYKFSGATLLLEDTVVLKLLVDAKDTPAADYADYYVKASDSDVKVPLTQRDGDTDGSHLKALVEIPFSKLGTSFTFAVYNGEGVQVSHSLTYSVDTYAARTANLADQADLVAAIRAAGIAAYNYVDMYTVANLTSILAVDYSKGSATDANNHKMTVMGVSNDWEMKNKLDSTAIKFANGNAVFDKTYAIGYEMTKDDIAATANSLTIESVFTLKGDKNGNANWGWTGIISNEEGTGSWTINHDTVNNRIVFRIVLSDGTKPEITYNATTNETVHVVATVRNGMMALYVNGELVGTAAISEGATIVPASTSNVFVGANAWSWGNAQCPANCTVEYVNMYAEGVTAEQVAAMYAAAQAR